MRGQKKGLKFYLMFHNISGKGGIRRIVLCLPYTKREPQLGFHNSLKKAIQLAYFTVNLNDKNTEQQIRIKEKSIWPSEPLEN